MQGIVWAEVMLLKFSGEKEKYKEIRAGGQLIGKDKWHLVNVITLALH